MKNILAFDIGGTFIKADIYDENIESKNAFLEVKTQVDYKNKTNEILNQLKKIVEDYKKNYEIDGIAISSAGVCDSDLKVISYAGESIPGYTNCDFKALERDFNIEVSLLNDVDSALLAESFKGSLKEYKNGVMITVGTGIGGSILIDSKILKGHNWASAEVGYMKTPKGVWQNIASASFLVSRYEQLSLRKNLNGKIFFEDYEKGKKEAHQVMDEFIENLCLGMMNILYILNLEVFVIGGGIFNRSDILIPLIRKEIEKNIEDKKFIPKKILPATLSNEAGRVGAVKHFLDQKKDF